ncbi:hypothetical protein E2320_019619 [Naja naja]|nr:hypothetical protein E2320_019619 [Naja naja]
MGVTSLWQILEPVKQHVSLCSLKGKTLAVDLSLWVCEAQAVKKMVGVVTNPHLRNLYCRVSSLTLMGIHLVFVTEGDLPKLKSSTCLELLECLGIPWVQAAGEAEAMCAYLNANGYVDGCITNDGDVFLYGAQTVYRNFTMNIKGVPGVGKEQALKLIQTLKGQSLLQREQIPHTIQIYNVQTPGKTISNRVKSQYQQLKNHFTVLCAIIQVLIKIMRTWDVVFGSVGYCEPQDTNYCCPCDWHSSESEQQQSLVEEGVKKKAKACEGFPFPEVIHEYLISKDKPVKLSGCQRPNLLSFQRFAVKKMNWTEQYACEKLCSLLTYYDMNRKKSGHTDRKQLQALRVIKTRIRNGIPCFEIAWQKPDHYCATTEDQPAYPFLITIEESTLFEAAYPEVVALYQMERLKIGQEKKKIPISNYGLLLQAGMIPNGSSGYLLLVKIQHLSEQSWHNATPNSDGDQIKPAPPNWSLWHQGVNARKAGIQKRCKTQDDQLSGVLGR